MINKLFALLNLPFLVFRRLLMMVYRLRFKQCGKNVVFNPFDRFSFQRITLGNDVYIGPGASISSAHSTIRIGSKVMMGPNVIFVGGNHNTELVGEYMYDIKKKEAHHDRDITVKDDVWIGNRAMIMSGVTLNEGCIVAAGAVVTKNVPSYSVVGGIPAKVIKMRFEKEILESHIHKITLKNQKLNT